MYSPGNWNLFDVAPNIDILTTEKKETEVKTETDEFDEEFQLAPELQELHVGPDEKDKVNLVEDSWTCILCQEDKQVCLEDKNPMVMLGIVLFLST